MRRLAVILAIIAALELWGILHTPTYDQELTEAIQAYSEALETNIRLNNMLRRLDQ